MCCCEDPMDLEEHQPSEAWLEQAALEGGAQIVFRGGRAFRVEVAEVNAVGREIS